MERKKLLLMAASAAGVTVRILTARPAGGLRWRLGSSAWDLRKCAGNRASYELADL